MTSFRIEPLGSHHDRAAFSCGVEALDRYLRTQVGQDRRRGVASCFVALSEQDEIAGYYTLAMTSISLTEVPEPIAKGLPRYPRIPAMLLGRLAVDHRFRGQQLGHRLVFDAVVQMLASKIAAAMLVVEAKDEAAAGFYLKFGFSRLASDRSQFFMPLQDIKALVEDA